VPERHFAGDGFRAGAAAIRVALRFKKSAKNLQIFQKTVSSADTHGIQANKFGQQSTGSKN
jgi:hypothetical protein